MSASLSRSRALALAGLCALLTAGPATAQDSPAPDTGFDVHGSVDAGYRFTDISGSGNAYKQLFNLDEGARLMGLEVRGDAKDKAASFVDRFSLTASGVGDPFTAVQATLRKSQRYDLRLNWRSSKLFDFSPLTPATIDGFDTSAVTDRHGWDTKRQIGSLALEVYATPRLRLLTTYDRVQLRGALTSTRSLDFVGSPATWGAFARANPYPVSGPVDDSANRFMGGFAYSRAKWTVTWRAGYQVYDEAQALDQVTAGERSINTADATTAAEKLSAYSFSASRHLSAPVSELSFVVQPSEKLEWRGEHIYMRYSGPFDGTMTFQGVARTNTGGTATSPYLVTATGRGDMKEPVNVIGQGLTYRPFDRWSFDLDYRYTRVASDATGAFGSIIALYSGAANPQAASEDDDISWRQTIHTADITATYAPMRALTIRPGVRLMKRSVHRWEDGAEDPAVTGQEKSIWPELSVGYRPTPKFSARGLVQSAYSDMSFTRMSPVQRTIAHAVVGVRPIEHLSIDLNADRTDADAYAVAYASHVRGGSATVSYAFSDRFTILGGFDWRSFTGLGNGSFARGTAPINDLPTIDREIDRVWQAGLTLRPVARLGVTATGNFDRTTGTDTIFGEPALYGASSFPYATVSVFYELPRGGRIDVDLQRTYWLQELLPVNNFSASLLTVRYSHGF
jgi:hypothetical protein